ncbi:polyprenyl synthetase family protein [Candidatus Latescibacterota bacterium]
MDVKLIRDLLIPGKMLCTFLATRLAECYMVYANIEKLVSACIATELVHTANLCHDDVIDNGLI